MAQDTQQNQATVIGLGRYHVVAQDLCSVPCESCGVDDAAWPVTNVMPDGCIAPAAAGGGRRLCRKCATDHMRLDMRCGHLSWLLNQERNGYMLYRVFNMDSGSAAHPHSNCVYVVPYASALLQFVHLRCLECGRDISVDEHVNNASAEPCRLRRLDHASAEPPVVADAEDVDRKTKEQIMMMAVSGHRLRVEPGVDAHDARADLYDMLAVGKMSGGLEDLHRGHKYVLEKNGVAVVNIRSRHRDSIGP